MANSSSSLSRARTGVTVARKVHDASILKLDAAIAEKRLLGQSVDSHNRRRARRSQRLSSLRRREAELNAASTVVAAPTVEEIREVRGILQEVKNVTVADAMAQAGLRVLTTAMQRSSKIAGKAKKG